MSLLNPSTLIPLAVDTLKSPRATFARLMALDLPRDALWLALLLVSVLSVMAAALVSLVPAPAPPGGEDQTAGGLSPVAFGGLQLVILLATVFLIHRIGRGMGGSGRLEDAILAVAWLQFILLCLQLLQVVAILILPALAGLLLLGGLVLFYWLLTAFVTELHGFQSPARVAGMIFVVLIGVALGLSFILTLSGVTVAP